MNTNLLLSPVFARPWRTLLKSLSTCCISLSLLFSNLYAASVNDVEITHCIDDCGKVLVGAARIYFEGIRWRIDDTVSSLLLQIPSHDLAFGFTGCSSYFNDDSATAVTERCSNGDWGFTSAQYVLIGALFKGANINFYFAPPVVSSNVQGNAWYSTIPSSDKDFIVKGEGIRDENIDDPVITLDTVAKVQDANGNEVPNTNEHGIDPTDQSERVVVPVGDTVVFTVTPRFNQKPFNSVKSKTPDLQNIDYVFIKLTVTEHDTQCSGSYISFLDQGRRENDFTPPPGNTYFHYLQAGGPSHTVLGCDGDVRSYPFLVSVNHPFHFEAINRRDTGSGHVDYVFYVNGHYDPAKPNEYVGSWKKFQLTNKAQLTVAKTGEGIISATGSNCSATGCTGTYYAGERASLTATHATGFRFESWSGDCSGTVSPVTVIMDKDKSCTAKFVQQTFALTVTTNGNGQVSGSGNYVAGTTFNLTATLDTAAGYQFDSWSPTSCAASPFVMPAKDITCIATFKKVEEVSPCATNDDSCQIMGPLNILNSSTPNFFPTTYPGAYFTGEVSIDNRPLVPKTPGGITLGGDDFTNLNYKKMLIGANITVAPDDMKKAATTGIDILVLVNYTLYTDNHTPGYIWWYMLEENVLPSSPSSLLSYPFFGEEWNGELSKDKDKLVAFSHIGVDKLSETKPYTFEIVSVNLPYYYYMIGTYDIYVGYRLTGSDQIIFSLKPIHFEIK